MALFLYFFIDVSVEKPEKKMTFREEFSWVRLRNVKHTLTSSVDVIASSKIAIASYKKISDGCSTLVVHAWDGYKWYPSGVRYWAPFSANNNKRDSIQISCAQVWQARVIAFFFLLLCFGVFAGVGELQKPHISFGGIRKPS